MAATGAGRTQVAGQDVVKNTTDYVKRVGLLTSEADRELWGLVCDVPRLSGIWPYLAAIINCVLPGLGTIMAGFLCEGHWSKTQIFIGIFQGMTAVYIIGWVWAIYWAYLIVMKAIHDKKEVQRFLADTQV